MPVGAGTSVALPGSTCPAVPMQLIVRFRCVEGLGKSSGLAPDRGQDTTTTCSSSAAPGTGRAPERDARAHMGSAARRAAALEQSGGGGDAGGGPSRTCHVTALLALE